VPLVQISALGDVLQLGMLNAVRFAVEPVAFPMTVLAACCARLLNATPFVATAKVTFPVAPLTVMPDPVITSRRSMSNRAPWSRQSIRSPVHWSTRPG
jgi:hypothetical protein